MLPLQDVGAASVTAASDYNDDDDDDYGATMDGRKEGSTRWMDGCKMVTGAVRALTFYFH